MRAALAKFRIIGAMFPPSGRACFDEADLVIRSEGVVGRVRAYLSPGTGTEIDVEAEQYSDEDWAALLQDGQAAEIQFPDQRLAAGAVLWVLRPSFESRETAVRELETRGVLLQPILRLSTEEHELRNVLLCLVDRPKAEALLNAWGERAWGDARTHALALCWSAALPCAEQAFVLTPELDEERLALLTLAYEHNGRQTRAEGYLEMARNSKGAEFRMRVEAHRDALRRQLEAGRAEHPDRRTAGVPRKTSWGDEARQHKKSGLERLGRAA
jgi:hypothetical protein